MWDCSTRPCLTSVHKKVVIVSRSVPATGTRWDQQFLVPFILSDLRPFFSEELKSD